VALVVEARSVHRVVRRVCLLLVGGERELDRTALHGAFGIAHDAEVGELDSVGDGGDPFTVGVEDRDGVVVDHVLRHYDAVAGRHDRLGRKGADLAAAPDRLEGLEPQALGLRQVEGRAERLVSSEQSSLPSAVGSGE
jgi:hypothetical protein